MVTVIRGIIVVEGGDGAGKSTLARHVVEHYGARYMHSRVWSDCKKWHLGILRRCLRLVDQGQLCLLDRHFISECVYGSTFRGSCYANEVARCCDEIIHSAPGVYVLCVPTDVKRHLARFEELKAQGREKFDRIERVIQYYCDLLYGNVAHPGSNYVDEYCRYGDFTQKRRVVHYDMDVEGGDLDKVTNKILKALEI